MDEKEIAQLLGRLEQLGNERMENLRVIAATGVDGRYSRTDAKCELMEAYGNRGKLIAIVIERDFFEVSS